MNQKGFAPIIIILGIVLLLGIAGGAYYFGQSSVKVPASVPQSPVSTSQTAISPTQSIAKTTISPTPSIDETANWKTYTNEKYKISFKYPPRLIPCLVSFCPKNDGDKLEVRFSDEKVHLVVIAGLNMGTNIGGLGSPLMHEVDKGTIQVSGLEVNYSIAEMDPDEKGLIVNGYFVDVKDKNLLIDYGGLKDQTNMKEFKQILSTFKFN